jgi:hypothetical protein
MPSVTIDAGVLAAPTSNAEKELVHQYFRRKFWHYPPPKLPSEFPTEVLALPTAKTSVGNVETLLDWKRLLDEPLVDIYMSEFAAEVLVDDGLYPLRPALESLFKQCGIVE